MFIIKKIEQVKKIKKLLNQIANLHLEERNGHLVNTDAKKESNIEIDLRKITASELVTTIKTLEYNIYSIHNFQSQQAECLLSIHRYYIGLFLDKVDQLLEQALEIFVRTKNGKLKGMVDQLSSLDLINVEIELECCLFSGYLHSNTCKCIEKTIKELDDILYAKIVPEHKEGVSYEKTRLSV